ncbi:hypothetical protein [Thiohalophilus thiocyanatoxydans]|uniref:HEAT repeat protein n=1 Tax=Thiohalophilus thiocyanatoxydans TaxID=381308 RepID=A0A4V3H3E7_9GAMM|nr:hypothetical protein [Thiohalophilus thiocyanatoxydans]TDX98143.1 hypothetical protein EDC23_2625 [Thiohalophilus thiocyanatoxydans]
MSDSDNTFAQARRENDERLLGQLDALRNGEDMQVLEPFARAYLGMFYEIEDELAPAEKVAILANREVSDAVLAGFVAALQRDDIPPPYEIGERLARDESIPGGYVVLAGMDRLMQIDPDQLEQLPDSILQSALCFHFANQTSQHDEWFDKLLADIAISAPALNGFWQGLINKNAQMLPGLRKLLDDPGCADLNREVLLPILIRWQSCKMKTFKELIFAVLRYAEHDELLQATRDMVNDPNGIKEENKRLYWLAIAFLLSPEEFAQDLSTYIGREKQKVLPLLDFMMRVSGPDAETGIELSPMMDAQLLRIIAPIFPPQEHSYGHLGGIDVNSRNVMRLFHRLATDTRSEAAEALKWLRKARVMKIYNNVIKHAEQLQKKISRDECPVPDFASYLEGLENSNDLIQRRNRFDIK